MNTTQFGNQVGNELLKIILGKKLWDKAEANEDIEFIRSNISDINIIVDLMEDRLYAEMHMDLNNKKIRDTYGHFLTVWDENIVRNYGITWEDAEEAIKFIREKKMLEFIASLESKGW